MSNALQLTGLIPPMISPLTSDGAVDASAAARLAAFLIEGGVDGIFVLGSSGEGPWLTPQQSAAVISTTVQAANGRVPVIAGALESGTQRTLEAAQRAVDAGADALVITTPFYFEADEAAQLRHFETLAGALSAPIMLYNIPSKTHNPLAAATVAKLLDIGHIIGIKDSAGDWENFSALLALHERRPDFRVLQGAEGQAFRALANGADGLVPGLGNCVPSWFARMIACARAGDTQQAEAIQRQIDVLGTLHGCGFWLACLKYAVSLHGLCEAVTSGGAPLAESAQASIRQIVEDARRGYQALNP